MGKYLVFFLALTLSLSLTHSYKAQKKKWTILYYAAGCNSSESDLMSDVQEMLDAKQDDRYNLILLIDRTAGHSEDSLVLGENFEDTRLYNIQNGEANRLNPNWMKEEDLNLGDAQVLKDFIQYGKATFPAEHYMLIFRSHGSGTAMCADNEQVQGDKLYPAELTDVLGPSESVDILGLDVCSMAGLENMYQWRPGESKFGADYVIASAPLSGAWAYDQILGRLGKDESHLNEGEEFIDPSTVGPKKLATVFYEEIKQNQVWASWALVDNSFIKEVKTAFDALGIALTLENDTLVYQHIKSTLAYHHNTSNDEEIARIGFPYLDAYHFCSAIKNDVQFNKNTRLKAQLCLNSLDRLTMDSYYGRGYLPETENFEEGKSGLYLIVPLGKEIFSQSSRTYWTHTSWYHPNDQSEQGNAYGKYDWCIDGAISGNNKVENWYEYLDSLFDEENDAGGWSKSISVVKLFPCNNYSDSLLLCEYLS